MRRITEVIMSRKQEYQVEQLLSERERRRERLRRDLEMCATLAAFAHDRKGWEVRARYSMECDLDRLPDEEIPMYELTDDMRDRLLVHGRQDAAMAFSAAADAFWEAHRVRKLLGVQLVLSSIVVLALGYIILS